MSQDLRSSKRKIFRSKAVVVSHGIRHRVETIDLSVGGISFHIADPVPVGHVVQIGFNLFLGGVVQAIIVMCEIRNIVLSSGYYRVGATFRELNDTSQKVISAFMMTA